ncbi:LysR family transcriptional regulator [Vibrio sonorensis]|uniref:LysR family transcriptional regulator n=1 Tax=Vibrio sonorensis TaxID=1004316 RepID=UPI0008D8DCC3|nr:LysR family transcriptional regulator [Vibrio sonorensis]
MSKLDLKLIAIFNAIMQERSITVAAQTLNMTQPSVSKAVTRMRHQWQDPLFVKKGRGIEPTPHAITLWRNICEPLQQIEQQFTHTKFDPLTRETTLRVALTDGITHIFWPYIRSVIESRANAVNIHAIPFKGNGEELLLSAEADLVFDCYTNPHPHIHREWLFDNQFTAVVKKGHELAGSELTLDKFVKQDHLFVSLTGDATGTVDTALSELGLERRVAMTVNSFSAAIELLLQSSLIAVLPKTIVRASTQRSNLVELNLPVCISPAPISISWHRRKHQNPALMWLLDEIRLCLIAQRPVPCFTIKK